MATLDDLQKINELQQTFLPVLNGELKDELALRKMVNAMGPVKEIAKGSEVYIAAALVLKTARALKKAQQKQSVWQTLLAKGFMEAAQKEIRRFT
ncbi:hypothetical protein [Rummeliibacillus suwonensis]|uniref:hypothetical protein n=1 Tax=Rummeliibacillus suwonensis TaxID=1306154 RepID=UPI001AB006F4|nr:hypothetical protein [Rummeliibacillus suwonensis]MBO2535992.1 hypothetical protein [Rummeliibacillus suwonensis]